MVLQSERVFLYVLFVFHVVTFCGQPVKERNDKIDQTDSILKKKFGRAEYKEIQKTIDSNETGKKNILHQRKFMKYNNNLKQKPEPAVKVTNIIDKNQNLNKTNCAKILLANI